LGRGISTQRRRDAEDAKTAKGLIPRRRKAEDGRKEKEWESLSLAWSGMVWREVLDGLRKVRCLASQARHKNVSREETIALRFVV
jgi:hypothetical protein